MKQTIKETVSTPGVSICLLEHRIAITGNSRLEDPTLFFQEFENVLDTNIREFKTFVNLDFHITYINSSSSKWMLHILKNLQFKYQGTKIITINWFYDSDDDSMLEAGEIFQELVDLPFNIIENIHG